jgi:hypothetical protein
MDNEPKLILCPYCGHTQTTEARCEQCGGIFEQLSRKATQIAMGPWYMRDPNRPFRPGCSYDIIVKQIKAGKIKPTSILRGPTTRQFWSVARNIPGVAHLLGYCHRCGAHVEPAVQGCPFCGEPFLAPPERNELGLAYATDAAAEAAQRALDKEIAEQRAGKTGASGGAGLAAAASGGAAQASSQSLGQAFGFSVPPVGGAAAGPIRTGSTPTGTSAQPPGSDLLREVLGTLPPAPGLSPAPVSPGLPGLPPVPTPGRSGASTPADRNAARPRGRTANVPPLPPSPAAPTRTPAAPPAAEAPGKVDKLKKLGLTTWLLIGAVVVVGALLIAVVVSVFTQTTPPSTPTPQYIPAPGRQPTTKPAPAAPRRPLGSATPGGDPAEAGAAGSVAPPFVPDVAVSNPAPPANPPAAPRNAIAKPPAPSDGGPAPAKAGPGAQPPGDPWKAALAEVDDLEKANKLPQARDKLKTMRDVAGSDAMKLKTIEDRLQELTRKINNRRGALFPAPPQP